MKLVHYIEQIETIKLHELFLKNMELTFSVFQSFKIINIYMNIMNIITVAYIPFIWKVILLKI